MTAKQLYEHLKFYLESKEINEDTPVLITLADASVGGRANVEINSVCLGFDWESGQLRIEPKEKIFRNIHRFEVPIGVIREEFGGVKFNACGKCHMRIAKDDRFCRHCGQRLK